jgi:predicted acylesterase/phospholipase RssA
LRQKHKWLEREWWFYATVGEAFFGLGDYKRALDWLVTEPTSAGVLAPEWEYESTARQLTRLALLKRESGVSEEQFEQTSTGKALRTFLKGDEQKLLSAFRGKFGLALSGGGFRASLYHIGVLAKLAELDVLRHVEALSCVSGGSIVGAYYYLELRKLYRTKKDEEIERKDYIEIVTNIEKQFLEGVQRNIRTRVLAEFTTNVKLLFWPGYSRTRRVGELYERELFSRIKDEGWFDGPRWLPTALAKWLGFNRKDRYLTDLYIHPCIAPGERDEQFYPKHENWKRKNKIPTLMLNATSLNSGHVWQFTASYMGEPPDPINNKVDNNFRLRRMYYKNAPDRYKKYRLGDAVAASSGVPGLFEPLMLDHLYPQTNGGPQEEISVKLVDGGVYDNQGVAGLLEQDCSVLLVSDASGQTESESLPSSRAFNVLWRANNISMTRVRGIQYKDMVARKNSSLLRGLMYVHLKQELPAKAIAWKTCPDHLKSSEFEEVNSDQNGRTSYEISADIQQQLAAVRTDLDSISEAEAYA